jgi:hypothetical protein
VPDLSVSTAASEARVAEGAKPKREKLIIPVLHRANDMAIGIVEG